MTEKTGERFLARLRVRLGKAFTSDETSVLFAFGNREVTLKGQERDQPLRTAKWVVFTAGGFPSEESAREFGERLRLAVDLAGVCTCIGINTGDDRATTFVAADIARQLGLIEQHERVAPNVHGLSIHPDDGLTRFPTVSAEGTVTAGCAAFLDTLLELSDQPLKLGDAAPGLRLLNAALMDQQPLSKLVLALSAVEALGQAEAWSERQVALINEIASQVEQAASGDTQKMEVADAMRRGLFRLSVRQGVKRVLSRLGLDHLRPEWDRLYGQRSRVFHGNLAVPESELHSLANATVTLCGKIILALAAEQGLTMPSIAQTHYPLAKGLST